MNKIMKYMSMLTGALLLAGAVAGCVDEEELVAPGAGDDSVYAVEKDEYGLGVVLSLDQLSGMSTRGQIGGPLGDLAGGTGQGLSDIEEYVNTENLYILFFNLDGIFLFQIDKPVAVPIGQSSLGNDNQWFIRIPVKTINENLIHYIEENPFKIAVLANWTFDSDINLGGNLSGWDEFRFNEPLDEEGNLVYDEFGKLQGDHISLLAHAQRDNVYENTTLHGYDHLVWRTETGPHMGPYTEWVANYHKNIDQADEHIRTYFDVKKNIYQNPYDFFYDENGIATALDHFDTKYNNIWQVWNFGGADDANLNFDMQESIKKDWLELNGAAQEAFLQQWEGTGAMLGWSLENYDVLEITRHGVSLDYVEGENDDDSDADDGTEPAPGKMDGIILTAPNLSLEDNAVGNPLNLTSSANAPHPYVRFSAHADGYVRVNYKAQGGAKLYAHVGTNNTPQNNASNYQRDNRNNRYEVDEDGYLVKEGSNGKQIADIPYDPKDVYLYMVEVDRKEADIPTAPVEDEERGPVTDAPMITIYSIEYIESRHLYDTDRRAILPSKEYPIPMYGIQDFDPIGEYWEPGLLFNLSQFNNAQKQGYNYRNVSLLRSISRVEVKLLKSAFPKKPAHVYMRSMNRSARMTPVDFFTPTDIVWNGFNSSSVSDVKRLQNYINVGNLTEQRIVENTPGVVQEEKNIMQYGPIYIGTNGNAGQSSKEKLDEYRKTTAWPFGIWEHQWGWDWNRNNGIVDDFDTYQVGQTRAHTGQVVPEYPRILHPRISRSDYSHFAEVDDPNYWHYIMYIPEKNITDADNPGDIADRPKIIHVELRFNGGFPVFDENGDPVKDDPENEVDNFDDKAAYRLYFTEGGRANLGNFNFTGRDSWDAYEYDWDIAKQHWPIIRNHVYIFTVNGGLDNSANIDFQVLAPDQRGANWFFY